MAQNVNGNTTKQKILDHAASLFADKGVTETSVRELADAVGLNPASLYYHFASKEAILDEMMRDYEACNIDVFADRNAPEILRANPTTDGIMACLQTGFPPGRESYFLKVLCVMLQEQLRNDQIRSFINDMIILRAETNIKSIIDTLIDLGVFRRDIDPDYWMKATSSLFFSFAVRRMLGIGDNQPGYSGMDMLSMLRSTFDLMFAQCSASTPA